MAVLMREAIGGSLRRTRTARRRTLRDVSRRARVSLGYLSEVERGRKEASSELLASICDALDIALPDLLTEAAETISAAALTESMAAALHRRPLGLRHMDLRLAGASGVTGDGLATSDPLSPIAPVPVSPAVAPAARPVARVRAAA